MRSWCETADCDVPMASARSLTLSSSDINAYRILMRVVSLNTLKRSARSYSSSSSGMPSLSQTACVGWDVAFSSAIFSSFHMNTCSYIELFMII